MATSPNYGWLEPDNTDLVKNGALAIRTLGNAIDTTMATMTPKSTVTAKGDIVAATAASTPAALAVGANGTTLVADSTATSGLRWTSTPAASNPVLNSAFNVWQRGTSIATSSANVYLADRWATTVAGSASTISRQSTNDTTNLPSIQYCMRFQRNAGQTNTTTYGIYQAFETANTIPLAGKTITLSFYARAGANYSPTSSLIGIQLFAGTGTDQNPYGSGYTGQTLPINTTQAITTTWVRYSQTVTLASTITEITPSFYMTPTGTAGAADYFEITGVQIDIGNTALPFRTAGVSYQQELALCQRYLPSLNIGSPAYGYVPVTNTALIGVNFAVQARVAPTGITIPALSNFGLVNSINTNATPSAIAFNTGGVSSADVSVTATLTAGLPCRLTVNASTGYILFTGCEL